MKRPATQRDEKDIAGSYERGEWRSVKKPQGDIQVLRTAARRTLLKDKRINIRVSSKDLDQVQVIAMQEGVPYQTLISSIIHKFVSGLYTERRRA
jgi:predicted DNA binding CopG/RHH family protein